MAKNKSNRPRDLPKPREEDIRDYAYHLYLQGDREPGHDVDHWFEAIAFLSTNNPPRRVGAHHNPPIRGTEHNAGLRPS